MLEISTSFPQDFHMISTLEIWFKANRNAGFVEFSTKSPSLPFYFFSEIELKSLTFLIFCLDKGVHFIISSLSLRKCIEADENKNHILKPKVIDSASKAIAIHDSKIWKFLSGTAKDDEDVENNKTDDIGKKFNQKKILPKLSFREDPISFLLILADSLQEEGREGDVSHNQEEDRQGDISNSQEEGQEEANNIAKLEALFLKENKIYTAISFRGKNSEEASEAKYDELKKVKEFLCGDKQFTIEIKDVKAEDGHSVTI